MRGYKAALGVIMVLLGAVIESGGRAAGQSAGAMKAQGKGASVYAELERAPEKARARRNPLEQDPDAVAAGRNLFEQHCAECHGAGGGGGKKGPSLRAAEVQDAVPGTIFWILTNGVVRRGMPVWSKLPEPRRWQLVAYIKSLGGAPASAPAPEPENPKSTPTEPTWPRH